MQMLFPPAHRLARINYPPRALFFAYAFLVVLALFAEGRFGGLALLLAVPTFLIYPHVAYLHARIAVNSKQAEFNNLVADSVLMGIWMAEAHFAVWPTCGALLAISLNNSICGVKRFFWGMQWFLAAAALWGAVLEYRFDPDTGALVTALCFFGIVAYVTSLGFVIYFQNRNLVGTRDVLFRSEEQFRFIAEHAGDLVSVVDSHGRIRYASESHRKLFEPHTFGEGQDWLALIHPSDQARAKAFLGRLLESLRGDRIQLRVTAAGGASRIVECQGNPVKSNDGYMQLIVLVCHDLTARARAEIDMRLAERAFDRLREAVLVNDNSGRIEFVNAAFTELTGHAPADAMGQTINELMTGLESEDLFSDVWKSVERDGNWQGHFVALTKSRNRLQLSARVFAIRDTDRIAAHYVWIVNNGSTLRDARAA
jgi:PAS domain S-box-containing protein